MALINIIISDKSEKIIKLLKEILKRLPDENEDEKLKQEIADKLDKAIADIKSTI